MKTVRFVWDLIGLVLALFIGYEAVTGTRERNTERQKIDEIRSDVQAIGFHLGVGRRGG